jgi:putative SOS response-associated peptidase YedK
MCYDMSFFSNIKLVADFLGIAPLLPFDFSPTYHQVAQSYGLWPVVTNQNGYHIQLFEWGLIAPYMNTAEKIKDYRSSMANARSEKMLGDRQSVWYRLRQQRCLVFADGFFEHQAIKGKQKKQPWFIRNANAPLLCMAGLYNYSPVPDAATGELVGTFSIVTRPANTLMQNIHNNGANAGRMPLLLSQSLALKWLQPQLSDDELANLVQFEWPAEELTAWPVNSIRTAKPNDASVIEKINPGENSGPANGLLF